MSSRATVKFPRMILLSKFEMGCVYRMGKKEKKLEYLGVDGWMT